MRKRQAGQAGGHNDRRQKDDAGDVRARGRCEFLHPCAPFCAAALCSLVIISEVRTSHIANEVPADPWAFERSKSSEANGVSHGADYRSEMRDTQFVGRARRGVAAPWGDNRIERRRGATLRASVQACRAERGVGAGAPPTTCRQLSVDDNLCQRAMACAVRALESEADASFESTRRARGDRLAEEG